MLHLIIKTVLCELHVTGDTLLWWLCYILSSVMRVETPKQTITDSNNKSWARATINFQIQKITREHHFSFLYLVSGSPGQFSHSQTPCTVSLLREQRAGRVTWGGWCLYFTARADAGAEENPSVTTQLRVAWAQRGERNVQISWESLLATASQHWRLIWILHA